MVWPARVCVSFVCLVFNQTRGKVYPDTIPLNEFDFVFILFEKKGGLVVAIFMKLGVTLIKHTMRTNVFY